LTDTSIYEEPEHIGGLNEGRSLFQEVTDVFVKIEDMTRLV